MTKIQNSKLFKIIDGFKDKKICVIGDLMLDHFIFGDAKRISPEAPVPIVLAKEEIIAPGGAGNVAANLASLGAQTWASGVVGQDLQADELFVEFKKRKIKVDGVFRLAERPTTQKIRIVAQNQQIVRVDKETDDYINSSLEKRLLNFLIKNISGWDALIIADYSKGLITRNFMKQAIRLAKKLNKPIIGDTKPGHMAWFRGVSVITPNTKEASEFCGLENIKQAGTAIQKKLNCSVIITQGQKGMTIFQKGKIKHISAQAREVFDVAGAGDTVTAVLTLGLVSGMSLQEAARLAGKAAGMVVGKVGTAAVLPEELKSVTSN